MQIYGGKFKSIPFPNDNFQKWDVVTPKDPNRYGAHYTIIDYRFYEFSNGTTGYYYILETDLYCEEIWVADLRDYEKLYSKRKEIALNLCGKLKTRLKYISDVKKDINKTLDIDTNLLSEGIEKIETFCKILEHIK